MAADKRLIETEALIVAYAMSRLDGVFLREFDLPTWKAAFSSVGRQLAVPATSIKNLRDEFDPVHPNRRKGWHKRALRANRQRILGEFCDTSDQALIEIVARILRRDREVTECVTEPLSRRQARTENVAERLRTGRLAEEHFLAHAENICGIPASSLVDVRNHACGYDFAVANRPRLAIEVKGMKAVRGDILFTDLEWSEATRRSVDYWLVVVALLHSNPRHRLIEHPTALLRGKVVLRTATVVAWRATLRVV